MHRDYRALADSPRESNSNNDSADAKHGTADLSLRFAISLSSGKEAGSTRQTVLSTREKSADLSSTVSRSDLSGCHAMRHG